jgi:hypothetical protein
VESVLKEGKYSGESVVFQVTRIAPINCG